MLKRMIGRKKMASIYGKWADATNLDPGDNGQITVMASFLMKDTGMPAEDAWMVCLMKWMTGHPNPEASKQMARAIIQFLNVYEVKAGLLPATRAAARDLALKVLIGG